MTPRVAPAQRFNSAAGPVSGCDRPSQPRPLELPNGPSINFFYVAGPDGARIEIVERPGLKAGQ